MMKIGIVTYHRAINYGALLQVYALQKKIKALGVECDIIDYRYSNIENLHRRRKFTEASSIKQLARDILLLKNYNLKYDKFREFAEKNLTFSKSYYSYDELVEIEDMYDKFIAGSDQVWNYKINKMDSVYFLDFVADKSKKSSYAASFGVNSIPEEYQEKYIKYLNDFDEILIREKQGAKIISDLISKESMVVVDPTLLISKEEWFEVSVDNMIYDEKYILVYAFGGSKHIMDLAKNISKKTGYKIIWISTTYKKSLNIKYVKSAGPDEYLGLFKNAEYIITNSFHGTIFSINFNKQFFTELLPKFHGTNSRMEDILDLFGIPDRIITDSNPQIIDNKIDYIKVNEILEEKRSESLCLLRREILG